MATAEMVAVAAAEAVVAAAVAVAGAERTTWQSHGPAVSTPPGLTVSVTGKTDALTSPVRSNFLTARNRQRHSGA